MGSGRGENCQILIFKEPLRLHLLTDFDFGGVKRFILSISIYPNPLITRGGVTPPLGGEKPPKTAKIDQKTLYFFFAQQSVRLKKKSGPKPNTSKDAQF